MDGWMMMMLMMETSKYDDNTFRFEYIRLVGRVGVWAGWHIAVVYANRCYCCYFEVYLFIQFPYSTWLEWKGFYLLLI